MTRVFRSKSCSIRSMPSLNYSPCQEQEQKQQEEEEEDEGYFGDFNSEEEDDDEEDDEDSENPSTTPFITCNTNGNTRDTNNIITNQQQQQHQFSVLALVATVLRRSLVTCAVEADDVASDVDIGWPTDVQHVSHVTFDRFNGFLGLPLELQPDVPRKPPSASARVFGVSAQSMQCSYDQKGNSVPTILLRMQNRLYSEGGLQAEGIFRINAENSQEEDVRNQLNKGIVPTGIDVHCLSGLMKAWFRELPTGVLDSLTPEQVMHCNTEAECSQLVKLLPPTEAALLDWAINLMADVVENEHHNKMNARNIAMVFAPNMTQMADPLTALIHAVQVMNFLKTLIMKSIHEREESAATSLRESTESVQIIEETTRLSNAAEEILGEQSAFNKFSCKQTSLPDDILRSPTPEKRENEDHEASSFRSKSDVGEKYDSMMESSSPVLRKRPTLGHSFRDEYENVEGDGLLNRLGLRKGIQRLCRHPVFQLSKTSKKSGSLEL